MKVVKLWALPLAVVVIACGCGAGDSEMSATAEWTFQLDKTWELHRVGDAELQRPAEPRIADDGTLYFHDFGRHLSYAIDNDGQLISSFAARGDGEGEVPFYINCFAAGDYVVICAPDRLHFFDRQGQFLKAVPNNLFVSFPLAFRNENEFWLAPGALGDTPDERVSVTYVNLAADQKTTVHEFTRSDEERKPTGGALVRGLTPQIKMALDRRTDRIYFGKNTDSVIYWSGVDNNEAGSFSFSGVRQPVSEADKRDHFAAHNIPAEQLEPIVAALPDRMTYYNRIQVVDGLLYLFRAESISGTLTGLDVEIYSTEGRHLYHGRIQLEDGWHISGPDNLQLAPGFVFVVQENDTGDKKIVKYKTTLPKSSGNLSQLGVMR